MIDKARAYIKKATKRAFMKQFEDEGKNEAVFVEIVQLLNDLELIIESNPQKKAERLLMKEYDKKVKLYREIQGPDKLLDSESFFAVKELHRALEATP